MSQDFSSVDQPEMYGSSISFAEKLRKLDLLSKSVKSPTDGRFSVPSSVFSCEVVTVAGVAGGFLGEIDRHGVASMQI